MFLYLAGATLLGLWLLPKISTRVESLPISRGLTAFTFVAILLYAWTAEILGGMAALTGAFLAGVVLSQSQVKERIESRVATLAYGVFVPIFFVNVGLSANARELSGEGVLLFLTLLLVAVIGKVFGCGLGANMAGFSRLESIQLGAGMMSRGEVGLIVASVGIAEGWIGQELFAAVVGVVIATTLLTPPSLRYLFMRGKSPQPIAMSVREGGKK
jgi:Kef-type K+ transport system membrane component KefB